MSLINDALKKAQRERAHPATPAAPTPPVAVTPTAHPAALPAPSRSLWPFVLVLVALVGGGTAVWFLKPGAPASAVAQASQPDSPGPAPSPAGPGTIPIPVEPVAPTTGPIATPALAVSAGSVQQDTPVRLQLNLPATPAAAPVPAPTPTASAPQPTPVAAATPPPAAAPSQPESLRITLQLEDPRVLAFLDAARINGVRSVADDAKLLMNNKVFRVGAVVDRELGLKLVEILPAEIVFEDPNGLRYRKLL